MPILYSLSESIGKYGKLLRKLFEKLINITSELFFTEAMTFSKLKIPKSYKRLKEKLIKDNLVHPWNISSFSFVSLLLFKKIKLRLSHFFKRPCNTCYFQEFI